MEAINKSLAKAKVSDLDGSAPDSTDFANYFCAYAYIYHQKDMLEDHKRTGAYHQAILNNRRSFQDKAVLDVGTGSGILAIFAAQAGARKVYAVEATDMAKVAKRLVDTNNLSNVVEVIQGTVETVELPEKVDIIISEWMGYFLMRESMLDSVIVARDKFLKEGGAMYPSHARMLMAPIRTPVQEKSGAEFQRSMGEWQNFVQDVRAYYDVDMSAVTSDYEQEQREYLLHTACWSDVHPGNVLGQTSVIKHMNLVEVGLDEVQAPIISEFSMLVTRQGPVTGLAGFFDTAFKGSPGNPVEYEELLTTAPDVAGGTHWGQLTFQLHPAINADPGDTIHCKFQLVRQPQNNRLLHVRLALTLTTKAGESTTSNHMYKVD